MRKKDSNTEQIILQAAEAEFLEKGFGNAKTTAIARRAGVTQSMLNYYFRTKENLFQMVFGEKVKLLANVFSPLLDSDRPFLGIIKEFVGNHFDFVAANPLLVNFIYNEIITNEENRAMVFNFVFSEVSDKIKKMDKLLRLEIRKGNIRPIKIQDLVINIVALNLLTFMGMPIVKDYFAKANMEFAEKYIEERKQSNIDFVMNSLRPV